MALEQGKFLIFPPQYFLAEAVSNLAQCFATPHCYTIPFRLFLVLDDYTQFAFRNLSQTLSVPLVICLGAYTLEERTALVSCINITVTLSRTSSHSTHQHQVSIPSLQYPFQYP